MLPIFKCSWDVGGRKLQAGVADQVHQARRQKIIVGSSAATTCAKAKGLRVRAVIDDRDKSSDETAIERRRYRHSYVYDTGRLMSSSTIAN